jgi:hypothetical protein
VHFKRGGSSPNHAPRYHANSVSMRSEQDEEENTFRSIVQANSVSPHFVGAAESFLTKGKEPMEQVATDNELVVTFTSSDLEDESPKKKHWLFNRNSDEEEPQFTAADIFGSDSSDSSEEESLQKKCCSKTSREKYKCCIRCDHSDPTSSHDDCDSSDEDNDDGSVLVHTHTQHEQEPNDSKEMIQHEFKILLEYLAQKQHSEGSVSAVTSPQEEYPASLTQLSEDELEQQVPKYNDAKDEHQPMEGKIQQKEQEHYDSIMKMLLDLPIVDLCSDLCKHAQPFQVLFMVIDNLCASDLLELQQELQKRFKQADAWLSDLSTDDIRQLIAYVNHINDLAHLHVGHTAFWIQLHPWSRHAWRWGAHFTPGRPEQAPPDPDPPDLPDEVLDEAHSAFAATVPAVSVSDAMHAHVDAASAAFAAGVHDAINAAINAAPQAAFA